MKEKPIIGLTMRLEIETNRYYLGRDYSEALEGLGAVPFHISLIPHKKYITEVLRLVDGILLPGSDTDVDPHRYGAEPRPKLKKIVPEKDATDLMVIDEAEKLGLPILAICYGMQALNVARGGTLYQDIETDIEPCLKHEQGIPLGRNSHSLKIKDGTRIAGLITAAEVRVNSHHHQAVKMVGDNLSPTAWAKDGIIECIEDPRESRFVLGVQWHPELSWQTDNFSKSIFESFINACQA